MKLPQLKVGDQFRANPGHLAALFTVIEVHEDKILVENEKDVPRAVIKLDGIWLWDDGDGPLEPTLIDVHVGKGAKPPVTPPTAYVLILATAPDKDGHVKRTIAPSGENGLDVFPNESGANSAFGDLDHTDAFIQSFKPATAEICEVRVVKSVPIK